MFTQQEITTLTRRILHKFNPKQIILFGSYAFGTPTPDSDLDLCIVTDLQRKRKLEIMRDIRREINSILNGSLDILIYSNDEFAQRSSLENTLEHKILEEGKLLHG